VSRNNEAMAASRKILIYNHYNKTVLNAIRQRSTIAAPAASCPYGHQEIATPSNEIVVERSHMQAAVKSYKSVIKKTLLQ